MVKGDCRTGADSTKGLDMPLNVKWGCMEQGEKAKGDKSVWVLKTSDVQQVMRKTGLLPPTPFFPGAAPCPVMSLLFLWLQDKPDQEAHPAEKQTSSKKGSLSCQLVVPLALPILAC